MNGIIKSNYYQVIDDVTMYDEDFVKCLMEELEQYKNNWEELKEYIKKFPDISYASSEKVDGERLGGKLIPTTKVLNKMEELEDHK